MSPRRRRLVRSDRLDVESQRRQALALTLDVAPGNAGNYSLEDGSGQHFVLHQRLWTDEERVRLPPLRMSLP